MFPDDDLTREQKKREHERITDSASSVRLRNSVCVCVCDSSPHGGSTAQRSSETNPHQREREKRHLCIIDILWYYL